jgi:hypothetical protein
MAHGRSKILPVPYYAQPTDTSCQGTVLKMMATYLERKLAFQIGASMFQPVDIKTTINTDPNRPILTGVNHHENLRWWLEQKFPTLKAIKLSTPVVSDATDFFVRQIDLGMPVLCSVTHANNNSGHIILVVGFENQRDGMSSMDFQLVAHDPYGAYDPGLNSTMYGSKRWSGGSSLMSGGEAAPGRNVRIPISAPSRQHSGAHSYGQWLLSSVKF